MKALRYGITTVTLPDYISTIIQNYIKLDICITDNIGRSQSTNSDTVVNHHWGDIRVAFWRLRIRTWDTTLKFDDGRGTYAQFFCGVVATLKFYDGRRTYAKLFVIRFQH